MEYPCGKVDHRLLRTFVYVVGQAEAKEVCIRLGRDDFEVLCDLSMTVWKYTVKNLYGDRPFLTDDDVSNL